MHTYKPLAAKMSENSDDFFDKSKRGRGEVKHAILKYYLGAYFGRLGQTAYFDRLVYVDGFAGPGRYVKEDGTEEDGSPIVAIKTVINHMHYDNFNKPIHMYFFDVKEEYTEQLREYIVEIMMANGIDDCKLIYNIESGRFDELMGGILEEYRETRCPMLVFADPFGIKGVSMDLMRRVVRRPLTELFFNVMFSTVNRWVNCPNYNKLLNTFLGEENCKWKTTVLKGENKAESFIKYYVQKLTQSQRYLFHHKFGMKDQNNRNIYQLVFFTGYFKALIDMKTAMINNSQETERYVYSEFTERQSTDNRLSETEIKERVIQKIKEKFDDEPVSGKDIANFVWADTPYKFNLRRQLKKDLHEFIVEKTSNKFDEMIFDFTNSMEY